MSDWKKREPRGEVNVGKFGLTIAALGLISLIGVRFLDGPIGIPSAIFFFAILIGIALYLGDRWREK
ncbi:hypothetical protein U0C82_03690 [Fulvimarina sp. 2208YS6-2-32]|uniref:Uncharacterized protein n=1 Tax=Fulvimarina uroteuthidis TaxID=3098149 RepID=A0ABU5HZ63_9HYPH|nr:hypothetical protein [Fulvimarina sp. 2208YS6-2-32]MDY8108251.1 hypothetical protein [Fulvimarina sp. 2208YS6-2-32]